MPDDVILGIVGETLARPEYRRGVILDGVVRTVPQAEGLEKVFDELHRKLDAVISFEIDNDEIVQRLGGHLSLASGRAGETTFLVRIEVQGAA